MTPAIRRVQDVRPGDDVVWMYEHRGGYGYVTPVPAVLVKMHKVKAVIDAQLKDGGTKRVTVRIASLRTVDGNRVSSEVMP